MSLTNAKMPSLRDRHLAQELAVKEAELKPKAAKKGKVVKLGIKKGKKYGK